MTLIAINVLLDPDAATVEKARATNARLRESYPDGFALDANHAPHITLLQRFVRTADLDEVANAVAAVLRAEQSMNWECHAIGYYALADKDLRLVGIVIEPTEELRRLQQRIIDAVAPFAVENGTGEAFAPRPDGAGDQSADSGLREQLRRTPHRHELPASSDRRHRYPWLCGRSESGAIRGLHLPGSIRKPLPSGGLRCRTE